MTITIIVGSAIILCVVSFIFGLIVANISNAFDNDRPKGLRTTTFLLKYHPDNQFPLTVCTYNKELDMDENLFEIPFCGRLIYLLNVPKLKSGQTIRRKVYCEDLE